ncbi:DUF2169 family type VI secretion system accessory protein [Chondromyces crocatus]|uniref:DUF2169 domain-containing protein n=1 Tax=Chondromyces crocatus TaxID=52 RepID=A0A0K1EPH8_CHOCO|nr:DUF2169 domain-containing protein [Chondromyces crocatus]AKT42714.1 uncharacterized protein CMC5_069410 [Chondromyces crocatus]
MTTITSPSPTTLQISATDPEGRWILSVLTKRTYTIEPSGRCVLADEQLPLQGDIETHADDTNLLAHDTDLYPIKPLTDVVVLGRAHAARPQTQLDVRVRVGRALKTILVVGDRRCTLSPTGQLVFSDPLPFETMPLRFDRAYGGRDRGAEALHGNPFTLLAPYVNGGFSTDNQSPYLYPKNPCGRGYLIEATPAAVELVELPNLEDPLDRLSPDRLLVGNDAHWPWMPMPQALGWVSLGWFPRFAFSGIRQDFEPRPEPIPEIARGLVPATLLDPGSQQEKASHRFANGAPLGLQLPFLKADEEIELHHLHPQHATWKIKLPNERPRIATDGRKGKFNETTPVIHTVLIEPELSRLSVVWRGAAPALRPYMEDELGSMPLRVVW